MKQKNYLFTLKQSVAVPVGDFLIHTKFVTLFGDYQTPKPKDGRYSGNIKSIVGEGDRNYRFDGKNESPFIYLTASNVLSVITVD